MTEDQARDRIAADVPRETFVKLEQFVAIVIEGAAAQNLISASTVDTIWTRHVLDSTQLHPLASEGGRWLDLGSGAGFPGLVIAILGGHQVILAESRTRRIAFLDAAVDALGLRSSVTVFGGRIERMAAEPHDVISARAFAPLDRLLETAIHLSAPYTRWLLPKGRSAQAELDAARGSWQGSFRVEPSVTDPDAAIIVADHVRPVRGGRRAGSTR